MMKKSIIGTTKGIPGQSGGSSKRMDSLIDDILKFSTLSAKQHFEKCSLKTIAANVNELLEHTV
jgi:signal transduction histidine kinase